MSLRWITWEFGGGYYHIEMIPPNKIIMNWSEKEGKEAAWIFFHPRKIVHPIEHVKRVYKE